MADEVRAVTTSSKLEMSFGCQDGTTKTITLSNANASVTDQAVQDLMETIVTSAGSIFDPVPIMPKAAKIVTTTSTDLDIED